MYYHILTRKVLDNFVLNNKTQRNMPKKLEMVAYRKRIISSFFFSLNTFTFCIFHIFTVDILYKADVAAIFEH